MNAKSKKPGAAGAEQRPEDVLAAARRWWTTAIVDIHPGVIRMRGYAIEDLIGRVSYPQMVWLMLRGELPTREQARLLEAALVAAVDHGPHAPSIAISRMAVTCGLPLNGAMASAINALDDIHGGAGQPCMELYAAIDADRASGMMVLVAVAVPSLAQQQPATGATTREETITAERNDKVAELWPERTSPIVDRANRLVERGFREGLDSGKGGNGAQIVVGGMRSGQGFTAGLGYRRSDLWAERLGYRATARATLQRAYLFDFNLDFQGLKTERTAVRWYTKYESSRDIDFYGLGHDTPKENHTSFSYDDLTTDVDAAYQALRHLEVGFTTGYLHADSSRGHDDFTPIDELFPPDQIPGFNEDTQFTRIGAFVDFDYRDSKTGPRSGGVLGVRYREYWDIDRRAFAFRQTEYEFQQFIPYFN